MGVLYLGAVFTLVCRGSPRRRVSGFLGTLFCSFSFSPSVARVLYALENPSATAVVCFLGVRI